MDAGAWASSVSAGVAVVSAAGSATAWWRSRMARAEATRQAARSVEAAERAADEFGRVADATERLAAVQKAHDSQAAQHAEAEERAPWVIVPKPGGDNCWLRNNTLIPKYDVQVQGRKIRGSARFSVIEGNQRVTLDVVRILHPDDRVTVAWHREEDLSDEPLVWHDDLPPRMI
jgi:hypothetical protein